ncbi:MAG: M28 family metallopeptidase [bacterium]|nr:M28 family metallopeptidase [bacterium]
MDVSIDNIEAHLRKLVEEIGPRPMGSREDRLAMDYIEAHLRRCGCEVEYHEFACPCWQDGSTSLTILSTDQSIPAQASQFTSACDIAGEIVPLRSIAEVNDMPVAGKICLLATGLGGVAQRNVAALALEARGALGLIVDRNHEAHPDAYDGKYVREPDLRRMPAACVSHNAAQQILASRSPVRLRIDARFWLGSTYNIQGILPGTGPGRIFMTAHHDTGAGAPGARDNGSSVSILLEFARLFSQERPPCEIRFVFTGAHERAGQGAQEFVDAHGPLVDDAVLEVNIDTVGNKSGSPTVQVCASEGLTRKFKAALPDADAWKVESVETIGLDAGPFSKASVPALGFTTRTGGVRVSHTQMDDMTAIDLDFIELPAKTIAHLIRSEFWKE